MYRDRVLSLEASAPYTFSREALLLISLPPLGQLSMSSGFNGASEAASFLETRLGTLFLLTCALVLAYTGIRKRKVRYPPGPPGWPIVGNAFEVPKEHEWLTYKQWSRDFSKYFVAL